MDEILHAAGITDELLAERIWQGLNATTVLKKTAYARREVLVDYRERREMVELVLKLSDRLTNKHEIQADDGGSLTRIVIEYVGTECDSCGSKGLHVITDQRNSATNARDLQPPRSCCKWSTQTHDADVSWPDALRMFVAAERFLSAVHRHRH